MRFVLKFCLCPEKLTKFFSACTIFFTMNFILTVTNPLIQFFKKIIQWAELRKFRDAVQRNPQDTYLRARFIKYCLRYFFQDNASSKLHVVEAVNQFEDIVHSDVLDLEVFYLMGKYYQGTDNRKAAEVYKQGLKLYNDYTAKSIEFR